MKMKELKLCPFCGGKIVPFICQNGTHWDGYWYLSNSHKKDCFLFGNEMFGYFHFGKPENGEPTTGLLDYIDKWNTRHEEGVEFCVEYNKKTNFDKVRELSLDDFCKWYWWMLNKTRDYTDSKIALKDWLQEEDT